MSVAALDRYRDLFGKKALAHLATIMPDGSPQVTPVWFDFDGTHFRVNSARGRVKDRNMRRNARVAFSVVDPDNAYRFFAVRGRVVDVTEEGGVAHIDSLAKKYLGQDRYPWLQGETRVIYKIAPESVTGMGDI